MSTLSDKLPLTAAERQSAVWMKLNAHIEGRLAKYRAKLETNLSPDETTRVRGCIAELKHLLAVDEPTTGA